MSYRSEVSLDRTINNWKALEDEVTPTESNYGRRNEGRNKLSYQKNEGRGQVYANVFGKRNKRDTEKSK